MRRIQQVKLTDWAVRVLITVTFFASFFAPREWIFRLVVLCFASVGVWVVLYPEGVLAWIKTAHPEIDENDSSIWWVPRLIGAFFLLFVLVLGLAYRAT